MLTLLENSDGLGICRQQLLLGGRADRVYAAVECHMRALAVSKDNCFMLGLYFRRNRTEIREAVICYGSASENKAIQQIPTQLLRLFSWDRKCYYVARRYFEELVKKAGFEMVGN